MPRDRGSRTCYLKTHLYAGQQRVKAFGIVPVAELRQEKMTLSLSVDTSTNCCDLAVVFWNIALERLAHCTPDETFFNLKP